MRQSIRALGWATKIFWIATAVFMVTSLYSPVKLLLERQIKIGSPQISFSNRTLTMSLPFFINNTGFYDLSALNVTTSVADCNETLISTSTTFVQNIPRGGSVNETHRMSISLDDIISKNLAYVSCEDTTLNLNITLKVNASVSLKIAHVIPLQVSTSINMSWELPLFDLYVREVGFPSPYNSTHYSANLGLDFENHLPFAINGTIRLEIFNEMDQFVGLAVDQVNAPPGRAYGKEMTIYISSENLPKFTRTGEVHAYFESPMISLDWWFTYG